ncbi:c-type cytochrome domain-containing protein [Lignipirellula cremea]|uniref:c-type cytochrome domain-containing protein n=1 Tax=Lignipirellula cremea TaxID=2528010 RepID=UPI0011A802A2|nr:c-type cytochrome domain-containing protein [Lignipirellula cremea]
MRFNSRVALPWLLIAALLGIPAAAGRTLAAEAAEKPAEGVSYFRDIRPIFQTHCQGCHQPAKQSGEYVMTDFTRLIAGGESGDPAVVAGKPAQSYLIANITPIGDDAPMPKNQPPLSPEQILQIRQWITEGAKDDTPQSNRPQYDADNPPVYAAAPVITSLDYSPDGKLLAVAGYHEVLLHKADGSEIVGRLVGVSERIESVAFSPDGKRLAVAGGNPGRMGEVQVWDVADRKLLLATTVGYDTCYGASWSPDGKLIAFGCPDNTSRAIQSDTGKQVLFNGSHSDWVLDTVFSVAGDHLVTVSRDQSMKLMNVPTERFIDNITSITPGALKGGIHAVDRHPTKDELLVGGADGAPKTYKMFRDQARKIGDDFNRLKTFPALPGRVFDVAYSADGSRAAAGSSFNGAGQIRVFESESAKEIAKIDLPHGGVFAVEFSPDGQTIASGGFDGVVRLHNASTGELVAEFAPAPLAAPADGS